MTGTPTFLVTLATGQQGRATIEALLQGGAKVHAVVRDATKDTARALERQGVVLFQGSNDDLDVFRRAAEGVQGMYMNLVAWPDSAEPARQAAGILATVEAAGVEHVVLSTSCWAGARDKWDVPENHRNGDGWLVDFNAHEARVEDAVRAAGLPAGYTIIRPGWFHSNYHAPLADVFFPEMAAAGELVHSFRPGAVFPHISVGDIGRFAAMALRDPAAFGGLEVDLASENLSAEQVADAIQKATGKTVTLRSKTAQEEAENPGEAFPWQRWASTVDLTVDVDAVKEKANFRFTTLEEYLAQEKSRLVIGEYDSGLNIDCVQKIAIFRYT
jgi:uncharacterized protein YbjT (DUF2867 family)